MGNLIVILKSCLMKNKILTVLSLLIWISNFSFSQTITLSTDKTSVAEGQSITITATLSAPSSSPIKINFAPSGTASNSIDYLLSNITTAAGGNGSGNAANQLINPWGVAFDTSGNIYVSDTNNNRIQKWVPGASSGITVAGGNGVGSEANQLSSPRGLAIDSVGNIYVADFFNNRIQKWAPGASSGITVAGGNGVGFAANQLNPFGVVFDTAGNMYVADYGFHRIQKWSPGATFGSTVAGGYVNGSASNQLNGPFGVAIDVARNVYVADYYNKRIQKWAPGASSGVTVAGGDCQGIAIDAAGNIYVADASNQRIQKWAPGASSGITVAGGNGQGAAANQLSNPYGIAIDAAGNIYLADASNHRIQKWAQSITIPAGQSTGTLTISTIADAVSESDESIILTPIATGGILASSNPLSLIITAQQSVINLSPEKTSFKEGQSITITATLSAPSTSQTTINFAPSGTANNSIDYALTNITTLAGGKGGGNAANQFSVTNGVAIDATGNIYVSDWGNHRIQKWLPGASSGITVAGGNGVGSEANQLSSPFGVAIDAVGNIYVADRDNNRIQKWAPGASSGTTVAGGNGVGFAANQLNHPYGIAFDAAGNIYVADTENHRIQKWVPGASSGITVAGGNGQGAAANQLIWPYGVAIDAAENIYVADYLNHRIQKWAPGATFGITVAGGNGSGNADNQLSNPSRVAIDTAGNIYVADYENHRIQKWAPGASSGTTVAGGNGQGRAANQLNYPYGIAIDAAGNIYVADRENYRIQKWAQGDSITIPAGQTSGALVVSANVDATSENDETIILTPIATGGILASSNPLSLIITAQQSVINLSPEKTSFKEGQSITITATLSAPSTSQTTINFAPSGTAQVNIDFQLSNNNNQIIIPAGQTSGTINVSALADPIINESDETIILTPTALGGILASSNPLTLIILNVPDSDNDGITDDIDKCLGTPTGMKVNTFGCSEAQQVQKDTCTNVKPIIILKNGLELSTPLNGVGYNWYLNEIKISNANTSSYLATSSGRYSVQVLKTATCITGVSENIFVQITGTTEENNQFIVFPNPFTKDIKIEFSSEYGLAVKVSISDIKGSIVYSKELVVNSEILNLSNFSTGTYFLIIYSNHSSEKRVFKLLKE